MRSIFARLSQSHYFPDWLKTSAMQQGGMLIITSCVSIILMSSLTISYVDYHLDELNDEIEQNIEAFMKGETSEIDDEPIDVAEDAGMILQVHNSAGQLHLLGDQELLMQALANLIENALRYCPKGSQINLSCHIKFCLCNYFITMSMRVSIYFISI